ncbi:MAG: phytanoyl-CoA dioxygenase family protein [Steroidobacteraceae bacterium]|nr:phytanoyl-CoA dioxygenase family protein [Steroidobacteraceae bacterium]
MKAVPCISPPELDTERLAVLRDALDRDGFIIVPAALNDDWVACLRRAFDVAPVPPSGTQHVTISDTTSEVESWRALERHPLFVAGAEHVLGSSQWVAEVHGRNPLPGFGQQGLHPDAVPRAPGEPYSVFTALWMLDDFTPENGATRVVPRSHLSPHPPAKSVAQPLAHHPDERIAVGRAGSVLLMNGHLWHSGRRNDSTGPRRCVQMVARRLRS